jgi:ABC-type antimicrobial peptide transport system permease subunit
MRRIEAISKELAVSKSSEYQGNQAWSGMIQGFAWAIAAIAIVIGGLGMMNAMVMSVLERTREIGTLRAVGWSRGRVVRMILGESLLLSLIGGVAGLGLGYLLVQLTTTLRGVGAFFIGVFSPEIFIQGLATALCLGLVGGAYPAWTAANLQPVEALRYEGGGTGEVRGWLARSGGQSFRNLWRRRTRSLIAAASIGVGVATLVMLGCIVKGLIGEFNSLAGSSGVGNITIMQRDVADMSLSSLDERFIAQIRAMPGVKSVSPLILGFINTPGFPFFVVMGLDLNSAAMDHFKLAEGRGVQRPDEIILGKAAAKNYKLEVGDTLTLYSTRYKVVGIYETGTAWEEGGGVIGLAEAQRLLRRPRSVSYIFINVRSPAEAKTLIASLNGRFTEARAALSSEFAQSTRDVSQTKAIADAVGLLALLIGGIVVANTMIMSIHERTREIGTLRALGWRRRQIMGQIIGETLLLCLLAGILGSALGVTLIWLIVQIPGADAFIKAGFDLPTMVRAILLALVVGTLGGLYPAWRASNLRPVEALRYE